MEAIRNLMVKILLIINYIENPKAIAESIVSNKKITAGFLIGIVGACAAPITQPIFILAVGKEVEVYKVIMDIPKAIIFYALYSYGLYLLCKLVKGEARLVSFISQIGWTFLPLIALVITFLPYAFATKLINTMPNKEVIIFVYFLLVILALYQLLWAFRLNFNIIAASMNFSRKKSIVISLTTALIFFLVYDLLI